MQVRDETWNAIADVGYAQLPIGERSTMNPPSPAVIPYFYVRINRVGSDLFVFCKRAAPVVVAEHPPKTNKPLRNQTSRPSPNNCYIHNHDGDARYARAHTRYHHGKRNGYNQHNCCRRCSQSLTATQRNATHHHIG